MSDTEKKHLETLKAKYQGGRVSALVGAGFSKNACPCFPSWDELLFDMVLELYPEEIEVEYLRYRQIYPTKRLSLKTYQKQVVPEILAHKGYLRVVSDYIARKGYREAIENYIEERVPYIDEDTREFRFSGCNKDKRIAINQSYFSAHARLLKCQYWERIYTTNYDRLFEFVKVAEGKDCNIITKAQQLSVNVGDVSVIKLHGDLYHPGQKRAFCFDGNPHQQYVISEDDYKNYPKEHEAFTQLMRISLLQGVFCLIGFSGDDPNFINWIEWVRDVLVRDEYSVYSTKEEMQEEDKEDKIYLIGLSKDYPTTDKQLFYENHRIIYIPLLRESVLETIGALSTEDVRDILCHFFDYLEANNIDNIDASVGEERIDYLKLWGKVYDERITGTVPNLVCEVVVDEDKVTSLWKIKTWNRFVEDTYRQKNYLGIIRGKESLTNAEAKLAILALWDTGLLVDENLESLIRGADLGAELLSVFQRLNDRTETICSCWSEERSESVSQYDRFLRALFSFNFSDSKKLLEEWRPIGVDVLKKAVFLDALLMDGSVDMLKRFLKDEPNEQEKYYATRLLKTRLGPSSAPYTLSRFVNAKILDYYEILSRRIKKINNQATKVVRYGDDKEGRKALDNAPEKVEDSLFVLHFLLEAPALLSNRNFLYSVRSEDWYVIHKTLFEIAPETMLFYSVQCTDRVTRTRIGQDYAYSDSISESCLSRILVNLLKALLSKDTPNYLKTAILDASKEMFISVPCEEWEALFIRIWEEVITRSSSDKKDPREEPSMNDFAFKGLNSLRSKRYRNKIIADILRDSKQDTSFAINCLYYLHVDKEDSIGGPLWGVIDSFISGMDTPEEITIAGNLFYLLGEEQKIRISNKCSDILRMNYGRSFNVIVYNSAWGFVKNYPEKRKTFLASVCGSPRLWESGINGTSMYFGSQFIPISRFMRGLYFDKASLSLVFSRLKSSLHGISSFYDNIKSHDFSENSLSLLIEMHTFLKYFEKRLRGQTDYYEVVNKVEEYYKKLSGERRIEDGLFSLNGNKLVAALNYIIQNSDTIQHPEMARYVNAVINRVQLKNSDGLDDCLVFLRMCLEERFIGMEDESIIVGFVQILDRYKKEDAQECNMDLVKTTREMARIATMLLKKGQSSPGIEYWIRIHKSGRFVSNFN